MNTLRNISLALSVSALGAGLIAHMVPGSRTKKVMNAILAVFLLCCIADPFISGELKFDAGSLSFPSAEANTSLNQSLIEEKQFLIKQQLVSLITDSLKKINIQPVKIQINMDNDSKGGISISQILVFIRNKEAANLRLAQERLNADIGNGCEVETLQDDDHMPGAMPGAQIE